MTMYFTKDVRFGIDTCIAGSVGSAHKSAGHGDMDVNDLDEVLHVESFFIFLLGFQCLLLSLASRLQSLGPPGQA